MRQIPVLAASVTLVFVGGLPGPRSAAPKLEHVQRSQLFMAVADRQGGLDSRLGSSGPQRDV